MRRLLFLLTGLVVLGLPAGASAEGTCPNEALRGKLGSSALPDCRAYEQVSPVEKNGVDVAGAPSRARVASDGNAVQYVALGAFPGSLGTDSIGSEYIATRGSDGWSTHGITPPQAPPAFPVWSSMYVGDFSGDLNKGVFYALSPVTPDDPNVATVPNLYLRDDLLSAGTGHYQLLSSCSICGSPLAPPAFELTLTGVVSLAGASEDFSHVLFESSNNLLSGAEGTETKLYESVNGVLRLAGVLPDSACGTPPCVASASVAGRGASDRQTHSQELTSDAISRDGSRVIFTAAPFTPPAHLGFPNEGSDVAGSLYLREDGVRTVQLNASERSPAEAPRPAYFAAASSDASKIFLITSEQLTQADTDGQLNLYKYDVDAPAGHHLTLITVPTAVTTGGEYDAGYVVGVSSDGEYVYFYGSEALLAGQTTVPGTHQLYVWHRGELRYIGAGNGPQQDDPSWGLGSINFGDSTSQARVTPDGKHLVFVTHDIQMAEAHGYDNHDPRCDYRAKNDCAEVYLYSYDSGSVVCISCNSSGAPPSGDALIASSTQNNTTTFTTTQHLANALSRDGDVFFNSPDALVSQDTNGKYDVYEYSAASGTVRLISSGQSSSDSLFEEASPDGHDVFFTTYQSLVGSDVDGSVDLYDARVDGGIAAQQGVSAADCSGDLCQGTPAPGPVLSVPSSSTFAGSGNLPPTATDAAPVTKPKVKAKPKRKAKRKVRSRRRRVKRHGRARGPRVSHKSLSVGR